MSKRLTQVQIIQKVISMLKDHPQKDVICMNIEDTKIARKLLKSAKTDKVVKVSKKLQKKTSTPKKIPEKMEETKTDFYDPSKILPSRSKGPIKKKENKKPNINKIKKSNTEISQSDKPQKLNKKVIENLMNKTKTKTKSIKGNTQKKVFPIPSYEKVFENFKKKIKSK